MKRTHHHHHHHHHHNTQPCTCTTHHLILPLLLLITTLILLTLFLTTSKTTPKHFTLPNLPRFAYLVSGTSGDGTRINRLLKSIYHPRNYYLLHLDLDAGDDERDELVRGVAEMEVGNVRVVRKGDLVSDKGPSAVASTVHGVAVLLRVWKDWDWFFNLGADEYPLMRQDDILHIFSYLPRELNFVEHTSNIRWKEAERARPIIIDPALYESKKSSIYWAKEKRSMPSSFKLFSGSASVVLTRPFTEFCVWGWDNLPRTLLMYYTNFLSSQEGYFHTVLCNHKDYQNTTVNHDLRFTKWDNPPKRDPLNLTMEHFDAIHNSGALFARTFIKDDEILNRIDKELLGGSDGQFPPAGQCVGSLANGKYHCTDYGSENVIKPSERSNRLEKFLSELLDLESFRSKQCK